MRYLTQDDPGQSARASRLIESFTPDRPGFVSLVVLVETVWVLESCYGADAAKIGEVVETLLRIAGLLVAHAKVVRQALHEFRQQAGDFSDTLITQIAKDAGCTSVQTFDKGAAKRSGMMLLA